MNSSVHLERRTRWKSVRRISAGEISYPQCGLGRPEGIISPHGRRHPRASRGAEARDSRDPDAQSSVSSDAQTRPFGKGQPRETRTTIEGDHKAIEEHD